MKPRCHPRSSSMGASPGCLPRRHGRRVACAWAPARVGPVGGCDGAARSIVLRALHHSLVAAAARAGEAEPALGRQAEGFCRAAARHGSWARQGPHRDAGRVLRRGFAVRPVRLPLARLRGTFGCPTGPRGELAHVLAEVDYADQAACGRRAGDGWSGGGAGEGVVDGGGLVQVACSALRAYPSMAGWP